MKCSGERRKERIGGNLFHSVDSVLLPPLTGDLRPAILATMRVEFTPLWFFGQIFTPESCQIRPAFIFVHKRQCNVMHTPLVFFGYLSHVFITRQFWVANRLMNTHPHPAATAPLMVECQKICFKFHVRYWKGAEISSYEPYKKTQPHRNLPLPILSLNLPSLLIIPLSSRPFPLQPTPLNAPSSSVPSVRPSSWLVVGCRFVRLSAPSRDFWFLNAKFGMGGGREET